uniref:Uncharacterized protein n=2 Tax=Rhodnius prolixus TaxID=13249 RepID=T1I429_RHOPR
MQARRYVPLLMFGICSIYIGVMFLVGMYKNNARYIKWYIAYIAAVFCSTVIAIIGFTISFA